VAVLNLVKEAEDMKNVVIAIAAAFALIAVPVWAQYNSQPTASTSQPATTTTTTTGENNLTNTPVETRTNPSVPTHSEDPGLTATGTVVSSNNDEVVLRTATGLTHFKILPSTVGNRTFTEGESISVDFTRNEQGVLLAKEIRSSGETTTTAVPETTTTTTEPSTMTPPEPAAPSTTTSSTTTYSNTTPSTTTESTSTTSTAMPSTASNGPLVGLLGLLALGGALALRRQ
jgi:MYXO-CTERM domain-containing protein